MGTNLGALLEQAGIKGGKAVQPKSDLTELRSLARSTTDRVVFSNVAMDRLPYYFDDARDPHQIRTGQDFLDRVRRALMLMDDAEFSEHALIGLCQLAHWHRDRPELSPSHKKTFSRWVIPRMLELKKARRPSNKSLRLFVLESLSSR